MALPGLVDHVASAIRRYDGDHTKGAGELAEIALSAASEFLQNGTETEENITLNTLYRVAGNFINPDLK